MVCYHSEWNFNINSTLDTPGAHLWMSRLWILAVHIWENCSFFSLQATYLNCIQIIIAYMPYLTLWDKISQNLVHLEGNSHKKFWSHRIFRPFYNRFYEEININHTLLWSSQASHMKKEDLRLYCGKTKVMFKKISQNFVKSPLVFCLISQILFHSLWHECNWVILGSV